MKTSKYEKYTSTCIQLHYSLNSWTWKQ